MHSRLLIASVSLFIAAVMMAMVGGPTDEPVFTSEFGFEDCHVFLPNGGNDYFSLEPGTYRRYEGMVDGELESLEMTVLDEVKSAIVPHDGSVLIAFTRTVEEPQTIDGELSEVSVSYFGRCPKTGNVFCFGEEVNVYENGVVVGHDGSWFAGKNGAQPGLMMPGYFLLGSRYCQALAPGISMDRAENVAMGLVVDTPAGRFKDCVMVLETSELDDGEEDINIFAPGFGLIIDDDLELVEYRN